MSFTPNWIEFNKEILEKANIDTNYYSQRTPLEYYLLSELFTMQIEKQKSERENPYSLKIGDVFELEKDTKVYLYNDGKNDLFSIESTSKFVVIDIKFKGYSKGIVQGGWEDERFDCDFIIAKKLTPGDKFDKYGTVISFYENTNEYTASLSNVKKLWRMCDLSKHLRGLE